MTVTTSSSFAWNLPDFKATGPLPQETPDKMGGVGHLVKEENWLLESAKLQKVK